MDSLKEETIHDLEDWHETSPNYPPASVYSIRTRGRDYTCNHYYDKQGNHLQNSLFHVKAFSKDDDNEWPIRNYHILVLHAEGKTGDPIVFTRSVPEGQGRISFGYAWDAQEEQFAEEPVAIRIYLPDKIADEAKWNCFKSSFFEISEKRYKSIRAELDLKARGRPSGRESPRPSTPSSSEFSHFEVRRPAKRLKTEESFAFNKISTRKPEEKPKLLAAARVRLLSEDSDHARVFSLESCDIKSLFGKAREFFGVKDPEEEFSLVCRAPGLGSRRFIGENCEDEFSLLCHDVKKLSIAERGAIELIVKPAAPKHI